MHSNIIDWFAIDMEAFQDKYDEYLAAEAAHTAAVIAREACEEGTCTHDRKHRKDGSVDRRSACPGWGKAYDAERNTGHALWDYGFARFFEAIGLGVNSRAQEDRQS